MEERIQGLSKVQTHIQRTGTGPSTPSTQLSLSDDQRLKIRRYQHIADKAMIRVNNRLCKKAQERETLWEQKQTQRLTKKARSTTLEFKDPSSLYPHLNLPEFHSPPSLITCQDSEDDVSDISQQPT